ncbi:hypothetical protein [Alteraurantiacibacter aquimixticola]|uniref:HEAT repeat domain-containing protein n=1 Tax=Alteraurantiacibacter aquimixticola TaxID=2489173 RepID=A0A4T3EWI2_9SPHN|nr:hypothetical protein [Alteraurantiacibacter aquimixticola]TIX48915.1 hypothetical protein E5222_14340 [Alteraurantiacibacter aquimixticola]
MPISEEDLRRILTVEEPVYQEIVAQLSEADIPVLQRIARDEGTQAAAAAVYTASLMQADRAREIVVEAAESPDPIQRAAAASGMENLPEPMLLRAALSLLDREDAAVTKLVMRAVGTPTGAVERRLRELGEGAQTPELREMVRERLGMDNN